MKLTITQIDTACMLIDINGFRILTDPAFDEAGGSYLSGGGRILHKQLSPTVSPSDLEGKVDLVLLSHDQHKDNLDNSGREFIRSVPMVISTKEARERLGFDAVKGIDEWESLPIDTDKVPGLKVTGTPCQHAPNEELSKVAGHVLGFILEWEGQENGALYISGDTVYFAGIEEIARRYKIDTAILHLGHAGFPDQTGDMNFTFTALEAIRVAALFNVNKLIPTHKEGWAHFLETPEYTYGQLSAAGLKDRLVWLNTGEQTTLTI